MQKLVLLGNTSVGKSCLVLRYVKDEFHEFQEPTIGAAFLQQSVNLDGRNVKLEIWDTAGQERYRAFAPMYYRDAVAAIVVYDITSKDSFVGAKSWIKELTRRADSNIIIAITGSKCDREDKRKVPKAEAQAYAEENNLIWMETSAKTGENVHKLFLEICKALPSTPITKGSSVVKIEPTPKKEDGGCC